MEEVKKKKNSIAGAVRRWPYFVALAAFVGGFLIAAIVWYSLPKGQQINRQQYQAVYLVNGQMYFGKLQNVDGQYLQLLSPYMPETSTNNQSTQTSGSLIRVKNQLWGPEDSIAIRADQVAFWQNLRDDSKVTQAIKAKTTDTAE
jgi:hypothetical protein